MSKIGDLYVDIHGNTTALDRDVRAIARDANRQLKTTQRNIDAVARSTKKAHGEFKILHKNIEDVQKTVISVTRGRDGIGDFLRDRNVKIKVDVDAVDARKAIRGLTRDIDRFGRTVRQNIEVDVDTDRATDNIERLRRDVNEISRDVDRTTIPGGGNGDDQSRGIRRAREETERLTTVAGQLALQNSQITASILRWGPLIALAASSAAELVPTLATAGTAAAGIGVSFAGIAVGTQGITDALENAFDPAKAEKFAAAFEKLSPAAQHFVEEIQDLAPAWKRVRLETQEALFSGLADTIDTLAKQSLPTLSRVLEDAADHVNAGAKGFAAWLGAPETLDRIARLSHDALEALEPMGGAILDIADAFLDISDAAAPALEFLVQGLADGAEEFANWIEEITKSGELEDFLSSSAASFSEVFGALVENLVAVSDAFTEMGPLFTQFMIAGIEGATAFVKAIDAIPGPLRDIAVGILAVQVGLKALGIGAVVFGKLGGLAKGFSLDLSGLTRMFASKPKFTTFEDVNGKIAETRMQLNQGEQAISSYVRRIMHEMNPALVNLGDSTERAVSFTGDLTDAQKKEIATGLRQANVAEMAAGGFHRVGAEAREADKHIKIFGKDFGKLGGVMGPEAGWGATVNALAGIALGLGAISAILESELVDNTNEWADALTKLAGGKVADNFDDLGRQMRKVFDPNWFDKSMSAVFGWVDSLPGITTDTERAAQNITNIDNALAGLYADDPMTAQAAYNALLAKYNLTLEEGARRFPNYTKAVVDSKKAVSGASQEEIEAAQAVNAHALAVGYAGDKLVTYATLTEDQQKAVDDLTGKINDSTASFTDLISIYDKVTESGEKAFSAKKFVNEQAKRTQAVQNFRTNLQKLAARGVDQAIIDDLAGQGAEAAGSFVAGLADKAKTSDAQLKTIADNWTFAQDVGQKIGQEVAVAMIDAMDGKIDHLLNGKPIEVPVAPELEPTKTKGAFDAIVKHAEEKLGKGLPIKADIKDAESKVKSLQKQAEKQPKDMKIKAELTQAKKDLADLKKKAEAAHTKKVNLAKKKAEQDAEALKNHLTAPATKKVEANTAPAYSAGSALNNYLSAPVTKTVNVRYHFTQSAPGLTPRADGVDCNRYPNNPACAARGGLISYATGGPSGRVSGPGGSTSDDVGPVMLSNGEFVLTAKTVQKMGGPAGIKRMVGGLDPKQKYAEGGPVGMAKGGSAPKGMTYPKWIDELPKKFKEFGKQLMDGFRSGLKSGRGEAKSEINRAIALVRRTKDLPQKGRLVKWLEGQGKKLDSAWKKYDDKIKELEKAKAKREDALALRDSIASSLVADVDLSEAFKHNSEILSERANAVREQADAAEANQDKIHEESIKLWESGLLTDAELTALLAKEQAQRDKIADQRKKADSLDKKAETAKDTVTSSGILSLFRKKRTELKNFATHMDLLRKAGAPGTLLQEISAMGIEAGDAFAKAILTGSKAERASIFGTWNQIGALAKAAGTDVAAATFKLGEDLGAGLVKGLQDQATKLKKTATTMADWIVDALKKELGIKSPSVVGFAIGQNFDLGVQGGLLAGKSGISSASYSLAGAITKPFRLSNGTGSLSVAGASGVTVGSININFTSAVTPATAREAGEIAAEAALAKLAQAARVR